MPTNDSEFFRQLGQCLDVYRFHAGLSLRDLADKAGTSLSQVQRVLQGENTTLRSLVRIADALGLDLEFLIGEPMHPNTNALLQFFSYEHLPPKLQEISRPCAELAHRMVDVCQDNPELTVGLRKLLEAKDCFVRANLFKKEADGS